MRNISSVYRLFFIPLPTEIHQILKEMKKLFLSFLLVCITLMVNAQTPLKKVYNENLNPMEQIDRALATVKQTGNDRFILCQVGGNWCPWCLRFADFASNDPDIAKVIEQNFILLHINYNPRKNNGAEGEAAMKRLLNPQRFGFPVFVVLDGNGRVLHTQDSSFLEENKSYSKEKVLRFLNAWTPAAVRGQKTEE